MKGDKTMTLPHDPTEQEINCPLCGRHSAKFKLLDFGRKKRYSCPTCIEFIISPTDEEDLTNLKPKEKRRYQRKPENATTKQCSLSIQNELRLRVKYQASTTP